MSDTVFIRDKEILPITSFSYGPMEFEAQQARVKLGPLTCHPVLNENYDIKHHLHTLQVIAHNF